MPMQSKSLQFIPSFSTDPRASLLCNGPRWWVSRNRKLPPVAALRAAASSRPCATSAIEVHVADASPKRFGPVYFEERIEKVIYRCRFLTIFGVVGSLMGSVLCFLKGCGYVIDTFGDYTVGGGKVIFMVIEAMDNYLIGTVMLVFGMGLYELFISNLDIAKTSSYGSNLLGLFKLSERPKWLEIQSVNELKTKLGHAIVMVLLVGLFEKSRKVAIASSLDLLCFAASILLCSSCLYLLSKLNFPKHDKHD